MLFRQKKMFQILEKKIEIFEKIFFQFKDLKRSVLLKKLHSSGLFQAPRLSAK